MLSDLRLAFRSLAKSPGFTAIAVLSLALGIGMTTAVFSLINGILLRSLPVPNPHELRVLQWFGTDHNFNFYSGSLSRSPGSVTGDSFPFPTYQAIQTRCAGQAEVFGYTTINNITARGRDEPFAVDEALLVTGNFFSGLGARAAVGRTLSPEDAKPGAALVAVLSYACWEKQFGLNPEAIGRTVTLNETAFTIVGVMPRGFNGYHLGGITEVYVSTAAQPVLLASSSLSSPERAWLKIMARLVPDASDAGFEAAATAGFAAATEKRIKDAKLIVTNGRAGPAWQQRRYQQSLLQLLGTVAIVVLIACANLAGLLLARGAARRHEFAVRAAIGAGRWRLARQPLLESAILAGSGSVLGVFLADWTKRIVAQLLVGSIDRLHYDTSLDGTVLGFTLAVATVTALLSGLLPALTASRVDAREGLSTAAGINAPRLTLARTLVTAQIALSIVLLAGATLYVRTLTNLLRIDAGFSLEHLVLFRVNARSAGYRGAQLAPFYDQVQKSLATIPGVEAAAVTQFALLGHEMAGGGFFELKGQTDQERDAGRINVGENFLETMHIRILLGRGLAATDRDGSARVVVVNQAFVRSYLPGANPLGRQLKVGENLWEIVGVCADALYTDLKNRPQPTVYFSYRQSPTGSAYFVLRTSLPAAAIVPAVRRALAGVDPKVPLASFTTQRDLRDGNISTERAFATLGGSLAAIAVLLASIGLYGLMAYNVTRRTREIGLRIALGALPSDVSAHVVSDALRLGAIGVLIGIPAALAATQLIRQQLYGVSAYDPGTLAFSALALAAVVALAAWVPARRAAHIDPMEALRTE